MLIVCLYTFFLVSLLLLPSLPSSSARLHFISYRPFSSSSTSTSSSSSRNLGDLPSEDKEDSTLLPPPPPSLPTSSTTSSSSSSSQYPHHTDGLTRFPSLTSSGGIIRILDYLGTISFACTGAATAASFGLDLFGATLVGTITAIGGGTMRDTVLLGKPPFWIEEVEYLYMCLIAAGLAFFFSPRVTSYQNDRKLKIAQQQQPPSMDISEILDVFDYAIVILDCVGIGAFAVIGTMNGIRSDMPNLIVVLGTICTCTFGGLARDVLCQQPVRILHSHTEIYSVTAAVGGAAYLCVKWMGGPPWCKCAVGFSATFLMRGWAYLFDVKLPTWDTIGDGRGVCVRYKKL